MPIKHISSYSGGIGSAITTKMLCDEYGKENVIALFADTKTEDEDLYRFNEDIKKLLGCEFITISDGRDIWKLFNEQRFIGNSRVDICSRILKRDLIKKWVKQHNPDEIIVYVGIDCSEEHRLKSVVENNKPYVYKSILIEKNIFIDNQNKLKWCKDNNIEIPRLYKMGFSHNNCGGFCVKAGLGHFKNLYDKMPERYLYHENKEQEAFENNNKLRPFLTKTINGKKIYLSLKQYRESYLDKEGKLDFDDLIDHGGCGCALE